MNPEMRPKKSEKSKNTVFIVIAWLILRIITGLWVAILSPLSPLTQIENKISVWPPSYPIIDWLDRILLTPWIRWDTKWYLNIISNGYALGDGTTSFHPLYPFLAWLLTQIGISPILGLLIISSASTIILLFIYSRLSYLLTGEDEGFHAIMILLVYPMAFILFAPYTESLFLLCTTTCFFFLINKKWLQAGVLGFLAALTRQQGIFLSIPIICELWYFNNRNLKGVFSHYKGIIALCLPPLGMLSWIVLRAVAFQDATPDFRSVNGIIYSLLISSHADKVIPNTSFTWPWLAFSKALIFCWKKPDIDILTNLVLGICFLILLSITWKRMRVSFRIYSLAITLVGFSYQTGTIHPYMGLPRHLFLAFPVFMTLASLVKKSWQRLLWSGLGLVGMLFLLLQYVFESWVP